MPSSRGAVGGGLTLSLRGWGSSRPAPAHQPPAAPPTQRLRLPPFCPLGEIPFYYHRKRALPHADQTRASQLGLLRCGAGAGGWGGGACDEDPHGPPLQRNGRTPAPGHGLTSRAQEFRPHVQTAVDELALLLLTFVDELVLHLALASHDDVLVRNGLIQVLSGKGGAAFHKGPVLTQVSEETGHRPVTRKRIPF